MSYLTRVRDSIAQFGVICTLHDLTVKATNRLFLFKVIKGVIVKQVVPSLLECKQPYRPMFLDEAMLRAFSKDPQNGLSAEFLDEALSKGDECYAILDSADRLAAYGWYARTPTRFDPPDLMLSFSDQYIYMYKGYTNIRHRGQRLHAIGMVQALDHYLKLGYTGLISCVESNNFSSLKSCHRTGYTEFGSIVLTKIFGRHRIAASLGCAPFGFRIEPIRADENGVFHVPGRHSKATWQ